MTNILTNIVSSPAGQEAQQPQHWFQLLIGALPIATFVAGYFTHVLGCRRDDRNRLRKAKDEFLTVLGRLESRIPQRSTHIDSWTEVFHRESIIPLRDAVFTVRTYLSSESAARVLDLWHRYEDEQADARSFLTAQITQQLSGGQTPPYPDEMLRTYMQRFRDEVGHAV